MDMLNVRETHPLGTGKWILFCDMFDDDVVTDQLSVNGRIFSKDEFQVEKPRGCFSDPKSRNIVLSTQMNCQNIIFAAFA